MPMLPHRGRNFYPHLILLIGDNSIGQEPSPPRNTEEFATYQYPPKVIDALIHGKNMWLNQQGDPECIVHAQTAGSLKGTDMLLMMAFYEQFHTIGWYNLFHGRISMLWGKTVSQINKSPFSSIPTTWAAQTIL